MTANELNITTPSPGHSDLSPSQAPETRKHHYLNTSLTCSSSPEYSSTPVSCRSSPSPNDGAKAWLQVVGSWFTVFNTWGTIITFGDYQAYYERGNLFQQTPANVSWIGSIQSLAVFAMGAVIGPIYDRGHLKLLLLGGTFSIVFGHMMLSLCHEYWRIVLAQGFLVGIGGGCLLFPSMAVIQPYFSDRLGLFVAPPPLLFMLLTEDKSKLGSRMGLAYALLGLAVLPGGPGAGGVLQHDPSRRDWEAAWTYAGVLPLAAFVVFCSLRVGSMTS